jgi:hypothetical protein
VISTVISACGLDIPNAPLPQQENRKSLRLPALEEMTEPHPKGAIMFLQDLVAIVSNGLVAFLNSLSDATVKHDVNRLAG